MEIYLAIINTYLSIILTFIVTRILKQKKENRDIKIDNELWKNEVRKNFNWLRKLYFNNK